MVTTGLLRCNIVVPFVFIKKDYNGLSIVVYYSLTLKEILNV